MFAPTKAPVCKQSARGAHKAFTAVKCTKASRSVQVVRAQAQQESNGLELNRRVVLGAGVAATAATTLPLTMPAPASAQNRVLSSDWEQIELPIDPKVVLLDIGFTEEDPQHGFLTGTRQTLLETFNGGRTWEPRVVEASAADGINYRFNAISFKGNEGWIVGKPAILLHTNDGGKNWERIPLSAKLPGTPVLVKALGNGSAEMTTDQGAIYVTKNTAQNWTAQVQETVDGTLNRTVSSGISGASYYEGTFSNIQRNDNGEYLAVSSRGNFYMTWAPGQTYWKPHNRPAARRLQNMGWTPGNEIWLSTRGGDVFLGLDKGAEGERFEEAKLNSRGFGILDVGYLNDKIAYACGGSGSLYKSEDGGKSWKRDKATDDVPANLYSVHFFQQSGLGFVLGNDAVLLKYIGSA